MSCTVVTQYGGNQYWGRAWGGGGEILEPMELYNEMEKKSYTLKHPYPNKVLGNFVFTTGT